MSDDREPRPTATSTSTPGRAPADRLTSVDAREADGDDVPVVYGVATPGGGRRGFIRALSRGVLGGSTAVLASCGGSDGNNSPTAPTAPTFTLSGTVTAQATGQAIAGATVEVIDGSNMGKSTTTASNGSYSLVGLVQSGCTARASASGCSPVSVGLTISANARRDFSLPPAADTTTFSMAGVVSNKNTGKGIGGGRVVVVDGPNANKSSGTDGNGYYSIPALVRGGFTARASATGYISADKPVGIASDTRVDFQLTPAPPAPCGCNSQCSCQSQHYWYPN